MNIPVEAVVVEGPMSRDKLRALGVALASGAPVPFTFDDLTTMIYMGLSYYEARDIFNELVQIETRLKALDDAKAWLARNAASEAPFTAAITASPEAESHKDGPTPAAKPGKSTEDALLPVKPPTQPLSREERDCAAQLAAAASRFISTFKSHLGKCEACTINWQTLRDAVGQWESVTK